MALPPLTPEQRAAALEKAAVARRERAEVKNRLKHSGASLIEVLKEGAEGGNEIVGKMKVSSVLESMPGVGKVRARRSWSSSASPRAVGSAVSAPSSSPPSSGSSAAPPEQRR